VALDRLSDNVEDPFDRHRNSRNRVGWKDLPHAITNVPVTAARQLPWMTGHILLWVAVALLVAIVGWTVTIVIFAGDPSPIVPA